MPTDWCLCLICGKHVKAAECRSIAKLPRGTVAFLCCLAMGYGLRLEVAKMILKDEDLKERYSCRKHYIQAAFWLCETNNSVPKKPRLERSTSFVVNSALLKRIQECATFFGDHKVTKHDVHFFFNDCKMRYCTAGGWTIVGAKERKEVAAQARKLASEKSGKLSVEIKPELLSEEEIRERVTEGLSEDQLLALRRAKCFLCKELKTIKHLRQSPLTKSTLLVLLSCLLINEKIDVEKAKTLFTSLFTERGLWICNEHIFSVDAYLRKKWGKKFGEQIEASFVGSEILEDETYTRLVEVSKSITQYDERRWKMTATLTQFFIDFQKRYNAKTKAFRKQAEEYRLLVQKFVDGCDADGAMTDPSCLFAQKKLEDQESAFLCFLNKPFQLDDPEPSASDPEMPQLMPMVYPMVVKGEVCGNFMHDNGLHNGPQVEDVNHLEHVFDDDGDDGRIVKDAKENVGSVAVADADSDDRSRVKMEKEQEDLSRSDIEMENDYEIIAASSFTNAQFLDPSSVKFGKDETTWISGNTLGSGRAQTKDWREKLVGYNNLVKSLSPYDDIRDLHANCMHVPINETQKQERFEIISSLSIRNHRAPFLSGLITCASKRIHFESHKRATLMCTDSLPGQSVLYTIWWSSTGILYHAFSQESYNFHSQMMTVPILMFQLDQVVKSCHFENIGEFGPILLCDEPRDYMTTGVIAKLHEYNFEILPYPLGSKDLLPSHYYFFKRLFDYIEGRNYKYLTNLKADLNNFLRTRPSNFFAAGINELSWRWNCCVATKGERVKL
ncbi:unnamed protein product [Cylicocyclus nassatus]|uniref:Lin-15A/B-like domain-containing protein n=1 Tax=Cylicocyclus nassatus TaxID=53992 RepID=A0AA36M3E1_CYLNA|nr:unnamed protein product [Cylicocyclus nassatus]